MLLIIWVLDGLILVRSILGFGLLLLSFGRLDALLFMKMANRFGKMGILFLLLLSSVKV